VVSDINGCCARTSRAGPQAGSSRCHIGITNSARPTSDEHRRDAVSAASANA
jgi:hypothetical protein